MSLKVLKIDATAKTVTEHTLEGNESTLEGLYRLIGCEMVEVAGELENGDTIWCDEEFLLKQRTSATRWCAIEGATKPLCGNLVVTGEADEDGFTTSHTSDIAALTERMAWLSEHAVAVWARFQKDHPFQCYMIEPDGTKIALGSPPHLHTHQG